MTFRRGKERKSMREHFAERNAELDRNMKANRVMASKLLELVEHDKIKDDFDEGFIRSVSNRINIGLPLTDKQQEHLQKCFDKY